VRRVCKALGDGCGGKKKPRSLWLLHDNPNRERCKLGLLKYAHVAQSAEHFLGKEEVMGPIPIVGFAQYARAVKVCSIGE
jgi:hypothetical protein